MFGSEEWSLKRIQWGGGWLGLPSWDWSRGIHSGVLRSVRRNAIRMDGVHGFNESRHGPHNLRSLPSNSPILATKKIRFRYIICHDIAL